MRELALRLLGELISVGVLSLSICFGFEPSLLFFTILLGFATFYTFCWLCGFSFF
jgi:hypothetical protein